MAQLQDAYTLYTELMSKSPYLSEEVLLKLAEKQNFPEAMLRDIMVANKQAAKYADVAEKLEERAALPDYMLDQIKDAAQNGVSAKEYLEAQIAGELHDLHDIVHQQIAALAPLGSRRR